MTRRIPLLRKGRFMNRSRPTHLEREGYNLVFYRARTAYIITLRFVARGRWGTSAWLAYYLGEEKPYYLDYPGWGASSVNQIYPSLPRSGGTNGYFLGGVYMLKAVLLSSVLYEWERSVLYEKCLGPASGGHISQEILFLYSLALPFQSVGEEPFKSHLLLPSLSNLQEEVA